MSKIYVSWNKAVRRIWNLPYKTHVCLLPGITGKEHIKVQIMGRFLKLYNVMKASTNRSVNVLLSILQCDVRNILNRNMEIIAKEFDVTRSQLYNGTMSRSCTNNIDPRVPLITEIIKCIDNQVVHVPNFEVIELQEILNHVATH